MFFLQVSQQIPLFIGFIAETGKRELICSTVCRHVVCWFGISGILGPLEPIAVIKYFGTMKYLI